MAIRGLTDRRAYFPRIGKIRLGVKTEGGGYPKDTDHFIVTAFPEIVKVYGEKPKRLIVAFPANDIEAIFPTALESWRQRKPREGDPPDVKRNVLFCKSNGETATRIYIGDRDAQGNEIVQKMAAEDRPEMGEMFDMPCPYAECPEYEARKCRETGRLNFVLPEVTFKGTYQIETSSLYGFGNILDRLKWALLVYGRVAGAYFYLSRVPQSMNPEALKGKTIIKHVLMLEMIDDPETIKRLSAMSPAWLRQGAQKEIELAADHPVELFPERVIPALQSGEQQIGELEKMAMEADLSLAEYELMAAKLGGDVDKIRAALIVLVNKKAIEEAIPLTPPQPLALPKQEQPPPKQGSLVDW